MKRTLAILATAALALSLAACGADTTGTGDYSADSSETVTSTDTMYNGGTNGAAYGTGVYGGANTNGGTSGTGAVAGAMNRAADDYRYAYTARNNSGYLAGGSRSDNVANADSMASAYSGRYQLMLENGRVHDADGYLLDGENAHYHTF